MPQAYSDDYPCDHFDCACPPFVTDGRVSLREWSIYVADMDITPAEQANAKVAHMLRELQ